MLLFITQSQSQGFVTIASLVRSALQSATLDDLDAREIAVMYRDVDNKVRWPLDSATKCTDLQFVKLIRKPTVVCCVSVLC